MKQNHRTYRLGFIRSSANQLLKKKNTLQLRTAICPGIISLSFSSCYSAYSTKRATPFRGIPYTVIARRIPPPNPEKHPYSTACSCHTPVCVCAAQLHQQCALAKWAAAAGAVAGEGGGGGGDVRESHDNTAAKLNVSTSLSALHEIVG